MPFPTVYNTQRRPPQGNFQHNRIPSYTLNNHPQTNNSYRSRPFHPSNNNTSNSANPRPNSTLSRPFPSPVRSNMHTRSRGPVNTPPHSNNNHETRDLHAFHNNSKSDSHGFNSQEFDSYGNDSHSQNNDMYYHDDNQTDYDPPQHDDSVLGDQTDTHLTQESKDTIIGIALKVSSIKNLMTPMTIPALMDILTTTTMDIRLTTDRRHPRHLLTS